MKSFLLFLFMFIFIASASAQPQKKLLVKYKIYRKATIYPPEGLPMSVKNLALVNDTTLKFITMNNVSSKFLLTEFPTNQVKRLKVKTGTYAGMGASIMGGIFLIEIVYSVIQAKNNPAYNTNGVNFTPVIVGFTAVGAVFGGVIGLTIPKWRTRFIPGKHPAYTFQLTPEIKKDNY